MSLQAGRWEERKRYPSEPGRPEDWGEWHKTRLRRDMYTLDLDNVEYRDNRHGGVDIVGVYELIRCPQNVEWVYEDPKRWAPYPGKLAALRLVKRALNANGNGPIPVFVVWRPPRMMGSEFLVSECEEEIFYRLTESELIELLEGLPNWPWSPHPEPARLAAEFGGPA